MGEPELFDVKRTRLALAAAELGGWYSVLEARLIEQALRTADCVDTTKSRARELLASCDAEQEQLAVSSCADDAFSRVRRPWNIPLVFF